MEGTKRTGIALFRRVGRFAGARWENLIVVSMVIGETEETFGEL